MQSLLRAARRHLTLGGGLAHQAHGLSLIASDLDYVLRGGDPVHPDATTGNPRCFDMIGAPACIWIPTATKSLQGSARGAVAEFLLLSFKEKGND